MEKVRLVTEEQTVQTAKDSLSLTNDGQLDIVFIGTGSAFAKQNRQTNFLVIKGDTHVMVDFGMTGPEALRNTAGLEPTDIGCILPTHSHSDHVGGIECLALMNRYVGQRFMKKPKLKIIITQEYERVLWDQTLRGGLEWNEESLDSGQKLCFRDFFDIIRPKWKIHQPREIFEVEYGDLKFELFRTKHIPEQSDNWEASFISYGLYFPDSQVFISGDTRFDLDLLKLYADARYIFHDVQFFPGAVHAPLDDLKTLPDDVKERMHLIHYADNYGEQDISGFGGFAEQGTIYRFA